ncbi:hypothetical protein [Rhodococcoides fascians]|uniref:hypothetical protein n=1 Tax=Rhodococcoides fascians TaxID=1828 RepID=UPI0005655E6F|nr:MULTISPECIES: hypothetical protein [Rhodococcus]OZD65122.1 hypothetical protein CH263_13340 [Rhodococcus sp. 06-1059B-a]OZE98109.1 hypothetical protein CH301_17350 [Rhodococcus sp. 15-1189-1-1a]OZF12759.1 hypothetical protein CH299_18035 [Rhodococcus sp. 14-2686-1-2]
MSNFDLMDRDELLRRRRAGQQRRQAEWIASYRSMRAAGFDHQAIARDLGVDYDSLIRSLNRLNVYVPEADERPTYERLEQLIAAGRPFSAADLPESGSMKARMGALLRARKAGRIAVVGFTGYPSRPLNVYQATQEDSQCLRTA